MTVRDSDRMMAIHQLVRSSRRGRLFLKKGPSHVLAFARWLASRWARQIGLLQRPWLIDESGFWSRLDAHTRPLVGAVAAAKCGHDKEASRVLLDHFRHRKAPRFFFDGDDRSHLLSLIGPEMQSVTIAAADQVMRRTFCFRGQPPITFDGPVDWTHCPLGNIDWMWDLNRHTFFEALGRAYWYTGDERYAQQFRELLLDWLANNPAGERQPNWTSAFEVAFRVNTWVWAFYYFRSSAAFDDETCLAFLRGLLAHGHYLDANLELHVQNNHLLLEAKALTMLGLLFPEFRRAERWRQRGLKILDQQIRAQVCPDGVHGERATLYHCIIAGELLELLVLLENNNHPVPSVITETLSRMVEFELWITKPNGLIPLFGDSALEDTHLRFSAARGGAAFLRRGDLKSAALPLDEGAIWLLGPERVKRYSALSATACNLNSRAFPEGGYFVMRHGQGAEATYLAFDCGPFGHKPAPNHGHADALSFELHAFGQTWLVDPGVYSYHLGHDWRNFFRSSRAHNTVVVDSQDQSILLDIWRVDRPAQVTLHQWITSEHFDFVDGSHDGYERCSYPITHRRQVFFVRPEYWVVVDLLKGRGEHCFDLYFHLIPGVDVQLDPESGSLYVTSGDGSGLIIAPLTTSRLQDEIMTGSIAPIQGWVSFFSGEKLPAPTLRYQYEGVSPAQFCTVLYPHAAGQSASVKVAPLDIEVDGQVPANGGLTSLQIETEAYVDYLIVDQESGGTLKAFAGYTTDARLLYMRHKREGRELEKVTMRGGRQLLFQDQSLLESEGLSGGFLLDHRA